MALVFGEGGAFVVVRVVEEGVALSDVRRFDTNK
jgi:hypothetical protein